MCPFNKYGFIFICYMTTKSFMIFGGDLKIVSPDLTTTSDGNIK